MDDAKILIREAAACTLCAAVLPHPPRPVFQYHPKARILIAGQAPGARVHASAVPFDDASGERLRDWLGVDRATFHDATRFAILPMGFCYPGTGARGDLPPRRECATAWRARFMAGFEDLQLTLLLGTHALAWHLGAKAGAQLTVAVAAWRSHLPAMLALPHPSPHNNRWLARNRWFSDEVVPALRGRVAEVLG